MAFCGVNSCVIYPPSAEIQPIIINMIGCRQTSNNRVRLAWRRNVKIVTSVTVCFYDQKGRFLILDSFWLAVRALQAMMPPCWCCPGYPHMLNRFQYVQSLIGKRFISVVRLWCFFVFCFFLGTSCCCVFKSVMHSFGFVLDNSWRSLKCVRQNCFIQNHKDTFMNWNVVKPESTVRLTLLHHCICFTQYCAKLLPFIHLCIHHATLHFFIFFFIFFTYFQSSACLILEEWF